MDAGWELWLATGLSVMLRPEGENMGNLEIRLTLGMRTWSYHKRKVILDALPACGEQGSEWTQEALGRPRVQGLAALWEC